jgi:hypothetical protein
MKKILLGVLLAMTASATWAQSASITCGPPGSPAGFGFGCVGSCGNGLPPQINISYSTGSDAGTPGLFWLGVLSPDQTVGAVMTLNQGWQPYQGGLYPPEARYDNGLPGTITITIPFPAPMQNNNGFGNAFGGMQGTTLDTSAYVGYSVYVGHGAYTSAGQALVADRRAMLISVKPQRVAAGTWQAAYDSDDQFIWSIVQKDMVTNSKYYSIITVPFVDCTPPSN